MDGRVPVKPDCPDGIPTECQLLPPPRLPNWATLAWHAAGITRAEISGALRYECRKIASGPSLRINIRMRQVARGDAVEGPVFRWSAPPTSTRCAAATGGRRPIRATSRRRPDRWRGPGKPAARFVTTRCRDGAVVLLPETKGLLSASLRRRLDPEARRSCIFPKHTSRVLNTTSRMLTNC